MKSMFIVTVRYANTGQKRSQVNIIAESKGEAMMKVLERSISDEARRCSLTYNQVRDQFPMTATARVYRYSK